MKKILLLAALMAVTGLFNQTKAQCVFTNAGVSLTSTPYTDPNTGNCMISIVLYFDIKHNPGGKYVYVHIWPANQYADYSYPIAAPPTLANGGLTNSIATFGFFHQGETVTLLNNYPLDANVPNYQFAGLSIVKTPGILAGSERFTVSGLIVQSAINCATPQLFIADAWESQSSQAQNVHCSFKGLQFYANDAKIMGLMLCDMPRTYKFDVSTINASGVTFNYKVYIDNGDRLFNKIEDTLQVGAGNNIVLDAANSYKYNSQVLQYEPYSFTQPYAVKSLWVVVTSPSLSNEVYGRIDNLCITLPVMLKNFTAVRNYIKVNLKWITETEINNKGFYVERKNTNGNWTQLEFINSAAPGGNSAARITYTFADINIEETPTQYRVRQVDFGEKASISETRMVAGKDERGRIIVYPNPTNSDELNLVFTKGEILCDLKLVNMNGMEVRQWNNFSGNKIYVNNIIAGMYNLNVIIRETKEQFNIKVAIQ